MSKPLSEIARPKTINEFVGQKHLLSKNKPLFKIISSNNIPNMIFYGPPGTGKTTLSHVIAKNTKRKFYKLNGTTASTADIKSIIENIGTLDAQNGILLYLDEIQYFNKKQQQTLLEFMENGKITVIASTTENPYFYIYGALLSRCVVFEFKPIQADEINKALKRALAILKQSYSEEVEVSEDVILFLSKAFSGDVRKAINILEICVGSSNLVGNKRNVNIDIAKELANNGFSGADKTGDSHYDLLSAFQKSMRGSDPDAAIYYLAMLLEMGDLTSVCRRLMVCAGEDVGLSYPQIIPIVKACVDIAFQVGLPEARIPLADAVIMVCLSPKSNSAYLAINKALTDIKSGKIYSVPRALQNNHFDSLGETKEQYCYPHDYKNSFVKQQYLPLELKDSTYYVPGKNKTEQAFYKHLQNLKNQLQI